MGQTLSRILLHAVFSTKHREPIIPAEGLPRLFAYLGTVADSEGASLIAAGGMPDHVHLLLALKPVHAPADIVRALKANSSRWAKQILGVPEFAWQNGYGIFSVSESSIAAVRDYLARQAEHHEERSFQDELRGLCRKHSVDLDERYVWD
jgi:putative transposase